MKRLFFLILLFGLINCNAQDILNIVSNYQFDTLKKSYEYKLIKNFENKNFLYINHSNYVSLSKGYFITFGKKLKSLKVYLSQEKLKDSLEKGMTDFFEQKITNLKFSKKEKKYLKKLIKFIHWNLFNLDKDGNTKCDNLKIHMNDYNFNLYNESHATTYQAIIKNGNTIRMLWFYNYKEVTQYCNDIDKKKVWELINILFSKKT